MEDNEKLFVEDDLMDSNAALDTDNLQIYEMSETMDIQEIQKFVRRRKLGTVITVLVCLLGTICVLALFSRPAHHNETDSFFRMVLDFYNNKVNGTYWLLAVYVVGVLLLLVVVLGFLTRFDKFARRARGGSFLYDRVGLCFEGRMGLRFLPALVGVVYFVLAAVMRAQNEVMNFDPPTYFPIGQHYSAGQWLNFAFVTLEVFLILLVVADAFISAGPWGAIVHLAVILPLNVYAMVTVLGILYEVVQLVGFIVQLVFVLIAVVLYFGFSLSKRK